MSKVAFYTLGCKLNFSETSSIARTFEERGFEKVDFAGQPDICVINTCTVTDNADKKCRKIIRDARKSSNHPFIIVMGCYAQLKAAEIAQIPGVDAVLGTDEKFKLHELINNFEKNDHSRVYISDISGCESFHGAYSLNNRTRTFLKIQDGCDYPCTYCTIPMARGKSRSDTIEHVVESAKRIAGEGVREIVLTGVNTGDFGLHNGQRTEHFIDLLKALDERADGIERFRISSIEPNLLTDEILSFVSRSQRFVPHFHIPLQSGCEKILRAMKRRYTRRLFADRIETIKNLMPDSCTGADVIVGFPGETEADFETTYRFLDGLDLSYLHVFTYSERKNTPAANMPDQVPAKIRSERSRRLRDLSDQKRKYFYNRFLNKTRKVLFEKDIAHGRIHGFTDNYIRVSVPYQKDLVNRIEEVMLQAFDRAGHLSGDIVKQ